MLSFGRLTDMRSKERSAVVAIEQCNNVSSSLNFDQYEACTLAISFD